MECPKREKVQKDAKWDHTSPEKIGVPEEKQTGDEVEKEALLPLHAREVPRNRPGERQLCVQMERNAPLEPKVE